MLPPPTQVPFMLTHPEVRLRPLYRVEVAEATKFPTFWMERIEPGVVVPMPTFPFAKTEKIP